MPNSEVQVYWRGELVGTIAQTAVAWQTHSFVLTGSGGSDELRFMETATNNASGSSLLDHVRLVAENSPAVTVAENAVNGTVVALAGARDVDTISIDTRTYSLTDSASGRFAINATTGVITVDNGSLLDFEAATAHSITVRVADASGLTYSEIFTISVTNVNETTVAVADSATAVEAGGVANGTSGTNPSGNVLTNDTDVDAGDTKTVSGVSAGVVGSASNNVGSAVAGSFGSINIAADGSYTYTVDNSNSAVQALRTTANTLTDVFTYTMRDTAGLTSTTQITVTIQGANDTPHDITGGPLSVNENASNGTSIGTVTGQDVDASESLTYSLTNSAGGRFAIDNNGLITVANGTLLDREAFASHSITVRVTDASGASYDKIFSIGLNDVDEFNTTTPTDADATANAVDENASIGTVVGITANAFDLDATNNTIAYSLFNNDGGRFAIHSSTGVVTVAGAIDRETDGASRSITIRAMSSDGSFSDQVFSISIGDIDEFNVGSIADINLASNVVDEFAASGTSVGVIALANDADATTNTITYTLDNTAGGRFTIHGSTGLVTVDDGTLLDAAQATSHMITIRATSADGSFSTQDFTIQVSNLNDAPTAVSDSATAVEAGGIGNGTAGSNPTGNVLTNDTDPDVGDTRNVIGVVAGTAASASGSVGSGVAGNFGSITINSDGTYTYTVDNSIRRYRLFGLVPIPYKISLPTQCKMLVG